MQRVDNAPDRPPGMVKYTFGSRSGGSNSMLARRRFLRCGAALGAVLPAWPAAAAERRHQPGAIRPEEPIELFNGRDLTGFYTWLEDSRYDDPRGVFSVVDGAIRISGGGWGGLVTEREYRDYRLDFEFRWGDETFGRRREMARDSGVLVHCQGPDGNIKGQFITSIEYQIIEGGTGGLIVMTMGDDEKGRPVPCSAEVEVSQDKPGGWYRWRLNAPRQRLEKTYVHWFDHDPQWKDVTGYRGPHDVERPHGEWNSATIVADGDHLRFLLNGVVVNEAFAAIPNEGRLLFQTEGAEIFFRKIVLRPVPAADAAVTP
jgi:hypothetical protein